MWTPHKVFFPGAEGAGTEAARNRAAGTRAPAGFLLHLLDHITDS